MKRVEELVRLVRVFIGEQLSQRLVTSIVFRYLVSQGRHARRDRHGPQEMGPLRSECHTRNVPPVGPDDITLRHLAGRQGLFVARGRSTGRLQAGRTPYTARSLRDGAESGLPAVVCHLVCPAAGDEGGQHRMAVARRRSPRHSIRPSAGCGSSRRTIRNGMPSTNHSKALRLLDKWLSNHATRMSAMGLEASHLTIERAHRLLSRVPEP